MSLDPYRLLGEGHGFHGVVPNASAPVYSRTVSSIWPPPMIILRSLRRSAASTCSMVDLHGVERHREKAGQRENVRLVLLDGLYEALLGLIDPQVVDGEAVDLEHEAHYVLADVVDVAADGTERPLCRASWSRRSGRPYGA